MKLTKVERLILSNQYMILAKLYPDDEEQYINDREIVTSGYVYNYDSLFDVIEEEFSHDQCRYVLDILEMHRTLLFSFNELKESDRDGLDLSDVKFRGFDGNNDGKCLAYTEFFIDRLQRYGELQNPGGYNSHSNTSYRYRPMLNKWRFYGGSGARLNAAQIKEILNAKED